MSSEEGNNGHEDSIPDISLIIQQTLIAMASHWTNRFTAFHHNLCKESKVKTNGNLFHTSLWR